MIGARSLAVAAALAALGFAAVAGAATEIRAGSQTAVYELRSADLAARIPRIERAGFTQGVVTAGAERAGVALLTVAVSLKPVTDRSRVDARVLAALEAAGATISHPRRPAELAALLAWQGKRRGQSLAATYQAVRSVLSWVRDEVAYEPLSRHAQPEDVLRERVASCVGQSNLAVALLKEFGLDARRVRGFLIVPRDEPGANPEIRLHRWLEVRYPELGWLMSDPLVSRDFVDAYHVVLTTEDQPPARSDEDSVPAWPEAPARLVEWARTGLFLRATRDRSYVVDMEPWPRQSLLGRRMSRLQYGSVVRVRLDGRSDRLPAGTVAVVVLPDGSGWERSVSSEGAIELGIAQPGPVRLGLRLHNRWLVVKDLVVGRGEVRDILLRSPQPEKERET